MYTKKIIAAVFVLISTACLFSLDSAVDERIDRNPFYSEPILDSILLTTSVALNVTVLYLDKVKQINNLEFDGNIFDSSQINGFDRLFMFQYSPIIDKLGTGLCIVSILTPSLLLSIPSDQWLTIGIMYTETISLAYGLKELGKLCVSRARPYMYFDNFPQDALDDFDWNKSFPSGHTTLSFAGASFTSFVFCKYFPNSKWKIPVIASSYIFAVGTAVCRIASGEHFITDVIAGAIAGTACGLFVPWIHSLNVKPKKITTKNGQELSVQVLPMGACLSIRY
ncbi:MAG: phosphatase PAP2 family protein [Spirochaetales bacterium]|nr:phosphatase PAP2 family protein [Spirochaetales bacterium]